MNSSHNGVPRTRRAVQRRRTLQALLAVAAGTLFAAEASAQVSPTIACDLNGVGSAQLVSDLPTLPTTNPPNDTSVTITSVTTGTTGGVPYCLVRLQVLPAITIVAGLPMDGRWNGRLQSEGGGGYAGSAGIPTGSIQAGYLGLTTDTGHTGGSGSFGMSTPVPNGAPNTQLQIDFAYRSEHLMAVVGKQLAQAFYGQLPVYSYWNGCSTGGRQGLRLAQEFPADYDGMVVNAPAIHWDRFIAAEIFPQVAMNVLTGGPIANAKLTLATTAAVNACDALDGVVDSLLTQPKICTYNPVDDASITRSTCAAGDNTCLTPAEAQAIQRIWTGPTGSKGKSLWFGLERGTPLNGLAGTSPFAIAVDQARYWVYFDPAWDFRTLTFENYEAFFKTSMQMVNPMMASENPNLSAFRDRGGKLVTMHGLADNLIFPRGTELYYDAVTNTLGGGYAKTQEFYRFFEAPGVGHCSGGSGPQPPALLQTVVDWVERGQAPDRVIASRALPNGETMTRPLCPYPAVAKYTGSGSTNDAANFTCASP